MVINRSGSGYKPGNSRSCVLLCVGSLRWNKITVQTTTICAMNKAIAVLQDLGAAVWISNET